MSKHTPGPWEMGEETEGSVSIDGPDRQVGVAYDHMPLSRANARLIAAAPELLEALLAVASMPPDDEGDLPPIPWVQQPGFAPSQYKLANQMRAAIAKATEEPTPSQ